ncbi:MAG TPA: hypothetical protein VK430_02340 [Xanthobacteraceae bacterium]|nr:hypothetical protein [Xanthobacteraceae bacterium]
MERFPRSHALDENEFDVVVDLAESTQLRPKSISIRYNGSPDSMALVARLLGRQTPHLSVCQQGGRDALAESMPAIDDKWRLTRGLQLSFARCIAIVERALHLSGGNRTTAVFTFDPTASRSLPAFVGEFIATKALNLVLDKFSPADQWSVAVRNRPGPFVPLADDGQRYYADPFLYAWSERTFIFVEEYRRETKKGVISAAEVVGGRLASAPITVLERPYHLSYPFVFADGGAVYMLPETVNSNAVELYRAVEFPWRWELASVLIEGAALADATPIFHDARWWLFAAMAEHGTTDHDELFIFYSDRLTGPWRPHSGNPVKSDCRSARPAGRVVRSGGRLFRPAQDCENAYGSGIVWHEIVELSPSHFREVEVARLDAPRGLGIAGLHNFDQIGQLQVVDIRRARAIGARRPVTGAAMRRLGEECNCALRAVMTDATMVTSQPARLGG